MKLFTEYLSESTKNYNYVIKFAEKPTDEQVEMIESWLKKYDLRNITKPSLVEYSHKDFIDIPNRSVHEIQVNLGLPISSYVLLQDLKTAANISEKMIVVRGADEPIERYASFDSWGRAEDTKATEDGFLPASMLSTDREYNKIEQPNTELLYGNEYNKSLLSYLAGIAAARPTMQIDPPAPLFAWIKMNDRDDTMPPDVTDFNADYDTPKPIKVANSDTPPIKSEFINSHGGMSDAAIPSVKFYKNSASGQRQVAKPARKI